MSALLGYKIYSVPTGRDRRREREKARKKNENKENKKYRDTVLHTTRRPR